jgi:hypothetical protein
MAEVQHRCLIFRVDKPVVNSCFGTCFYQNVVGSKLTVREFLDKLCEMWNALDTSFIYWVNEEAEREALEYWRLYELRLYSVMTRPNGGMMLWTSERGHVELDGFDEMLISDVLPDADKGRIVMGVRAKE